MWRICRRRSENGSGDRTRLNRTNSLIYRARKTRIKRSERYIRRVGQSGVGQSSRSSERREICRRCTMKWKHMFMKNHISRNKNMMSGQIKKLVTFDTRRIS
jgi:hypothetical protein